MSEHDEYAQWDAAYVLGSLSGTERAEYEEHLSTCARCRAEVAELAGLPGLLGQLSPAEALAGAVAEPMVGVVEPDRPGGGPHRRWLVPVAAAAAALLIGGVGGYAVSASRGPSDEVPGSVVPTLARGGGRLAFAPVSSSPMTAVVDVVPVARGTELRVECQYAQSTPTATGGTGGTAGTGGTGGTGVRGRDGAYAGTRYAIWVVGRDGKDMRIKDWTARSGRVMHPEGATPWSVEQIGAVEIRLADTGATVMRAQLG